MAKFEVVSKYADAGLALPVRATKHSAGYDFAAAADVVVPSAATLNQRIITTPQKGFSKCTYTLDEMSTITKSLDARITLVPTGIKCQLADDEYLEISVRSSTPLKNWLILGNGIGIIDSDYYNNPDNEGEIFFQLINLSPFAIKIQKGERIGQGIIHKYILTEDDAAEGLRLGGFGSTTNG